MMQSSRGNRNFRDWRESDVVPAASLLTSSDGSSATLTASVAGDITIAERHFASTSSALTSELEMATGLTFKRKQLETARKLFYEEESNTSTDKD